MYLVLTLSYCAKRLCPCCAPLSHHTLVQAGIQLSDFYICTSTTTRVTRVSWAEQIGSYTAALYSCILPLLCYCISSLIYHCSCYLATNYSHRCRDQIADIQKIASTDAIGDVHRVPPACCIAAGFSPAKLYRYSVIIVNNLYIIYVIALLSVVWNWI